MKKMPIFFLIFISIFFAVGFFVLGSSLKSLNRALAAKNWHTTTATLDDVQFITDNDSDGTAYSVDVKYSYVIGHQRYQGNNLSFGYSASSGSTAHYEIYEKLKSAKQVQVRYNPDDPNQSTLTYGANRSHFISIAFGVTWLLFVTGFTVLFLLFGQSDTGLLKNLIIIE